MRPSSGEMWNVVVQWLMLDYNMTTRRAKQSANNLRANGELEKAYYAATGE